MDHDQAKLTLANFRPNGSDLNDPSFAEALECAAKDTELGNWLARERAQDELFVESLAAIPIPENLRENLFESLAQAYESAPGYTQFDHEFSKAFKDIEVPAELRGDILAAMSVEKKVTDLPASQEPAAIQRRARRFPKYGLAAAAAVIIAAAAAFLWPPNPHRKIAEMTPEAIQADSMAFLDGNFILDRQNPNQEKLFQFLSSNELPSSRTLPETLKNYAGVGCKRLDFNDKPASLICFREQEGDPIVHLIVLHKEDVEGDLPNLAEAQNQVDQAEDSKWSVTSWRDEEKAFFLMSMMPPQQLMGVF